MALINDRDVLLAATFPRVLGSETTIFLLLTSDYQQFDVAASGVSTPTSITFTAHPFGLPPNVTVWGVTSGAILTGSGNTRNLAFSDLTTKSATITATVTSNGVVYTKSLTVSQYHAGIIGVRDKQHLYATGSAWSDALANSTVPSPAMQGDEVTIGNGTTFVLTKVYDGTAWVAQSNVLDGSLAVTNSISATSVNTNNLTIKDSSGVTIFSATTPLAGTYIANAAITNAKIDNAAITTAKIGDAQITGAKIENAAITNAKIGTAEVSTLSIAGQAVTIPVSAYTEAELDCAVGAGGWVTIQSASITSTGAPVLVIFGALLRFVLNSPYTYKVSLLRGSTTLYTTESIVNTLYNAFSATITDTPGSGSFTYYINVQHTGPRSAGDTELFATCRSLALLETKR